MTALSLNSPSGTRDWGLRPGFPRPPQPWRLLTLEVVTAQFGLRHRLSVTRVLHPSTPEHTGPLPPREEWPLGGLPPVLLMLSFPALSSE